MPLLTLSVQMSKQSLPKELETLLRLTKPKIDELSYETILKQITSSFNWTYFLERAIATNLAGYLLPYPEIGRQYFPPFVDDQIRGYQRKIQLHSSFLREAILEFVPQLDRAKIPYALLKGWDLHFRFGISLKERQISDIDLLIDAKDLDQVQAFFEQLGYTTTRYVYKSKWHERYQKQHTPLQAQKGQIYFDVHVCLFTEDEPYQININSLLLNRTLIDNHQVFVLEKKAAAVHFYLQLFKDLYYGPHFKPSLLIENHFYSYLNGIDELASSWNALKEIKTIQRFIEQVDLYQDNTEFTNQFYAYLSGNALPYPTRVKQKIRNTIRRTTPNWLRIPLFWKSIFPDYSYLIYYFGQNSYLILWSKRFFKLLTKVA